MELKKTEVIKIGDLKPHPKNYKHHPDDQLKHIINSIEVNGIYRNIVISKDGYILAGHGVVQALNKMEVKEVPVYRLEILHTEAQALKIVIGDNEIGHLAETDNRMLTNLLKEINDEEDLLGTGFDEMMLANLAMVTRDSSEISDMDKAAEWVGMPDYNQGESEVKVIVSFLTKEDKIKFFDYLKQPFTTKTKSIWWPRKDRDDMSSIRYEKDQEKNA